MRRALQAASLIFAAAAIYTVFYLCIVRYGSGESSLGYSVFQPDYRGIPAVFFQPIHLLDRKCLRPSKWVGYDAGPKFCPKESRDVQ